MNGWWIAGGVLTLGAAGVVLGGLCENRRLTVSEYTVTLPSLPAAFEGRRIVQLSDLHAASFGKQQERLVEAVRTLSPDAIVLTGDLIDRRRTKTETDMAPALTLLDRLPTIAPTVRTDGNHEPMSKVGARFRELAAQTATEDATGRAVMLCREGQMLPVIGIPDIAAVDYDADRWQAQMQALCAPFAGAPHLVLSHRPHRVAAYRTLGETVVLCGHAHGGQWRLPFIGGLFAPDQGVFPRYTEGLHRLGDTQMVISRGLGNSGFPLRLFNPPDIVVLTLKRSE